MGANVIRPFPAPASVLVHISSGAVCACARLSASHTLATSALKKQSANTLQERFGFADDDLKKSEHDEILLWLDEHAEEFAKEIIEWTDEWPARLVAQKLKRYQGLGDPPPQEVRITKIWEQPVTNVGATKYVIGFLDMVVLVENTELEIVDRKWLALWPNEPQRTFGFEAKTKIPSLGELIRQLRLYQQYCRHRLYVVSPDDRFAEQLLAQGFGFIKYPDGTIQKPPATRR